MNYYFVKRLFITAFIGLWLLLVTLSASAVIETYEFDNNTLRERYQLFTDELRCPQCQNQNLSGSNSPIAKDLRRELHRLLQEGQNDQQIIDYMVDRYGDFILYRPRFTLETAVLWMAPGVFLILGGLTLIVIFIRQKKKTVVQDVSGQLTLGESEREQLDSLLSETEVDNHE